MWEISYANINMLVATIPKYKSIKEEEEKVIEHDSFDGIENFI